MYTHVYKNTSTKMYTPFYIGFINNMDHLRISGTESSSVILGKKRFKIWKLWPKRCQTTEAKRDGIINLQHYNFNQFWHGKLIY